jgi:multicomponent Na+:H+ antiporter subunit G
VSVHEGFAIAFCALGFFFSLTGAIGIVRMPDLYTRIQCSSKTITMGAIPLLIALTIAKGPLSTYGSRALLVGILLLIVNPAASHAVARAAYKTGVPMWSGSVVDEVEQAREEDAT